MGLFSRRVRSAPTDLATPPVDPRLHVLERPRGPFVDARVQRAGQEHDVARWASRDGGPWRLVWAEGVGLLTDGVLLGSGAHAHVRDEWVQLDAATPHRQLAVAHLDPERVWNRPGALQWADDRWTTALLDAVDLGPLVDTALAVLEPHPEVENGPRFGSWHVKAKDLKELIKVHLPALRWDADRHEHIAPVIAGALRCSLQWSHDALRGTHVGLALSVGAVHRSRSVNALVEQRRPELYGAWCVQDVRQAEALLLRCAQVHHQLEELARAAHVPECCRPAEVAPAST